MHVCVCVCVCVYCQCSYTELKFFTAGSVLLNDELSNGQMANGDVAINMDLVDKQRYQQQLQLIDEQVFM